jgi:hypothetical protein
MAKQSESARLINQLHKKGYSDSAIGRAVNRDSSFIGQIRRGKKQGSNLTGSLKSLSRTGKATEPPRRIAKSGQAARVRRPSLYEGKGKGKVLVMSAPLKASDATWKKTLKQFEKKDSKVSVALTFTKWKPYANSKPHKQTVNIYSHGREPQAIIDSAAASGQSIEDYLIDQAKTVYKPDMAEGFQGLMLVEAGALD